MQFERCRLAVVRMKKTLVLDLTLKGLLRRFVLGANNLTVMFRNEVGCDLLQMDHLRF